MDFVLTFHCFAFSIVINNISVILWLSLLLVEETEEDHRVSLYRNCFMSTDKTNENYNCILLCLPCFQHHIQN